MKWLKRTLKVIGIGVGLVLLSVLSGYITMNIFLERDRIDVPVVIGLELKEAARQLREVGLQPRMSGEEYHAVFQKGTVIRQSPSGGSRILKNKQEDSTPAFFQNGRTALLTEGCLTTWPHRHDTDGFFAARLRRD